VIELKKKVRNKITGEWEEILTKLDTHELAWAAGFFDGEGTSSVSIKDHLGINPVLRITISQKNKDNLKRFKKAILNQGLIGLRNNTAWGSVWVYQSQTFRETQAIIALLWKYLGQEKKDQYIKAVEKYFVSYKGDLSSNRWKPNPVKAAYLQSDTVKVDNRHSFTKPVIATG
jgi:hypothetical protein